MCDRLLVLVLTAGLVGAVAGWLLKTASEFLAERRANRRTDVIWRREHYVDSVAILAYAGRELMSADSSISRAIYSLSNAEQGGDPAIIAACETQNRAASDRQGLWITPTLQALEAVRLYAPENVVKAADAAWGAIFNGGSFPDVQGIQAFEQGVLEALSNLRVETREVAGLT